MADDPVNPQHYAALGSYSALHVTEEWEAGYHLGQVLKYLQRYHGRTDRGVALVDLRKARWYLQRYLWILDPEHETNPIGNPPWDTSGRRPEGDGR